MDAAYNQHSKGRRKNRSTTNLNHLTLAPLTTKLPINDNDMIDDSFNNAPTNYSTSYLQGKSAPTTPALLSRSPLRGTSRNRTQVATDGTTTPLPKSKSTTHLAPGKRPSTSGTSTPGGRRPNKKEDTTPNLSARDRKDSDWLLRAGALISSEARESKGQAWLVSRASSTSLTGTGVRGDPDEDILERELARERELSRHNSRHNSRRGSLAFVEDDFSPNGSRRGSRSASRVGSRGHLLTPLDRVHSVGDGYFPRGAAAEGEDEASHITGPDFINLDEKLEAVGQDTSQDDEAHVRRLVKNGNAGVGTWFGNVLGWTLFSVEENDEEQDAEDHEGDGSDGEEEESMRDARTSSIRQFEGMVADESMPPPKTDEGGWQDAAWLLSVASKVAWS